MTKELYHLSPMKAPLPIDLVEPMIQMMRRQTTSVPVQEPLNGARLPEPSLAR